MCTYPLEIDHIISLAKGGSDEEENLWLACRTCNSYKGVNTHAEDPKTGLTIGLFNPRREQWKQHFIWSKDGLYIIGLTPCGRATVSLLQMNNNHAVSIRAEWVKVGWHPPK